MVATSEVLRERHFEKVIIIIILRRPFSSRECVVTTIIYIRRIDLRLIRKDEYTAPIIVEIIPVNQLLLMM